MNSTYGPSDHYLRAFRQFSNDSFERSYREAVLDILSRESLNWHTSIWFNFSRTRMLSFIQGVYVIWYGNSIIQHTVYVGQGYISSRISDHLNDAKILRHCSHDNPLRVSWVIEYSKPRRLGIENYLHDKLYPIESSKSSNESPIPVKFPWH